MSASVTTVNGDSSLPTQRRGGGGRSRGSRGRGRGSGPTQRPKPQNDPAPAENTDAAETPATPTTATLTLTEPAAVIENTDAAPRDDDSGICLICAEAVSYYSVPECNHRTCHVCALRLRALYKRQDCTFCKEPQLSLIFTTSPTATFKSFTPNAIPYKDAKLSIFFETQEMMEDTLILLRFNCPDGSCDYIARGWGDLKLHVRGAHGNLMCDLCIRMKKVFAHEHTTHPPNLMPYHLPSIRPLGTSQKPKDVDIEAHPMCEFCRECFYDNDAIYAHMRESHEECFVCKRNGVTHKFFKNYDTLETHFLKDHFPCKQPTCVEQKFVVFATEMDLRGHMVETHGAEMTQRDRRDLRRLDTGFEYEDHRRRGMSGNRGRGRDPLPQRPPPNVRRRELGTGLTTDTPIPSGSTHDPPVDLPAPPQGTDLATAERYHTLYSKVASIAANPPRAVGAVELSLRSYRGSESTARDLISSIWNVLDHNLDTCATLVNMVVDVLDVEDKKKDLLNAWNGFKIEQRGQFPELVPTSIGTEYAGIAGGRILNAKQQASRTSRPRRQVLDRVAAAASSTSWSRPNSQGANHFPALASTSRLPPKPPGPSRPQQKSATPWTNSGQGSNSGFRPQVRQPEPAARPQPKRAPAPPPLSNSAFPELPNVASNKPPRKFISGNKSLKNILGDTLPAEPAWGQGPSTQPSSPPPDPEPEPTTTKGRKGKGKQKQTLLKLGGLPT
ncbi:hypothetical protein BJ322DRAFT_17332 [Thelephora terrestris]|uniref:RING-type E3 ubiquitin transferase n=1 Tax=Thelephora terrestris TaxID=56493 RepID=A0A9P6HPA5_9AGAM|nr:hypothetical protein BJ322DRAFT_17332 [Thelephora terrestris]